MKIESINKRREEHGSNQEELKAIFGSDDYDKVTDNINNSFENNNYKKRNETIENSGFRVNERSKEVIDSLVEDKDCVQEDYKGNKYVRLDVVSPRKDVEFKVDNNIKEVYGVLYEIMKDERGGGYKRQMLWGEIATIGFENLPTFDVPGLLEQFKIIRKKIITISQMESQPSVDFSVDKKTIFHLYLTADEIKYVAEVEKRYFIKEPHKSVPYVMLIVSFIYSDYAKCLKSLRWAVEPYYRDMQEHVRNVETKIYNTNIRILENWLKIPADEVCYFIDYLTYFTENIKNYTNPDIKKQAELITEYCKNLKEYKKMYEKANTDFNNEKFDKLMTWAEKYERKGTEKSEVCRNTATENK